MTILQVNHLTKHFGGLKAVDGLDFEMQRGELLSLIGPNGAGKTTVFNLITSSLRPTAGRISLLGRDITHFPTHRIAALGVTRVFQHTNLFLEDTVLSNLIVAHYLRDKGLAWTDLLGMRISGDRLRQYRESSLNILEYFGLTDLKSELARNLSHGHRRCLGMAIGMATRPKVLLLDEPFTGMNEEETNRITALVRGLLARELTVMMVEHNIRAVRMISDRIIVMNFGQKIAEGVPDDVIRNQQVIDAYLGARPERGI